MTMRYMIFVKGNTDYEAGKPPSPALLEAIGKLAEKEIRAGRMVEMGGLMPSAAGAVVRASKGRLRVTDGPFAEAKEVIGGYAVFDVQSRDEILEMAKEFMQAHIDVLGPSFEGEVEVRQVVLDPQRQNGPR